MHRPVFSKYLKLTFFLVLITIIVCDKNPAPIVYPDLVLTIDGKQTVRINEQDKIVASVKDAGLRDVRYVWNIDGHVLDTTRENQMFLTWKLPDTGMHQIIVAAVDIHDVKSPAVTFNVKVTCAFPTIDIHQKDTTIRSTDSIAVNPVTHDNDGVVQSVLWQIDNDSTWFATSGNKRIFSWDRLQSGIHTIKVKAIDNDSLFSKIDTLHVNVINVPGFIKIKENDTTLGLHDSMKINASVTGLKKGVKGYIWAKDFKEMVADTTGTLWVKYGLKDTGLHFITVTAFDLDSFHTNIDTIKIVVNKEHPVTRFITNITNVFAEMPVKLHVATYETHQTNLMYSYFRDGRLIRTPVASDSIQIYFSVWESGRHVITAFSIDPDSVQSESDTLVINVNPGYPVAKLSTHIITMSSLDTTEVIMHASDPNDNGGNFSYSWSSGDTTYQQIDSVFKICYNGKQDEEIVCCVTDFYSLSTCDTVHVHFNTPPVVNILQKPADTLYCLEKNQTISFLYKYTLFDRENDSLHVNVTLTDKDGKTGKEGSHSLDTAMLNVDGPGQFFCKLDFSDKFGHVITKSDTFCIVENHTICFAGHSIVCGMGGDGQQGGFREMVLAGLRDSLLQYHNIKAFGPITTPGDMKGFPKDDSCFALSGAYAKEMERLQRVVYGSLSADIIVLMLGANANYTAEELRYTLAIMDAFLARNPDSRVYMLTSPPFQETDYSSMVGNSNLKTIYNKGIRDTVSARVTKGFHISLVEANTLLSKPDTTFDSTMFSDNVHPNDKGYAKLGTEILRVMKLDANRAIRKEFYRKEN